MASSVTKEDIKKLREAGYLSTDIAHRLPAEGQIIPTPKPQERVVFLSHFVRGLGFPLHPFVRGLMFYYGLDFHDLSPNKVVVYFLILTELMRFSVEVLCCEVFKFSVRI